MITQEHASIIRTGFFFGGILIFLLLELIRPYRTPSVSKARRWQINFTLTGVNSVILYLVFAGPILATVAYVDKHQVGLLHLTDWPAWLEILITVMVLDFALYVWHLLNHEMPTLWRFHRVHHTDLNMDVSTATRFHIGELAISALIKMGLIFFLGAGFAGVLIFETFVVLTAQFHHSSLAVSKGFESLWWILFVPPSMHRIHHSVVIKERNTNYGTIFSLWDRILGTMRSNVDQDRIRIGVGAYPKPDRLKLRHLLYMPLQKPVK